MNNNYHNTNISLIPTWITKWGMSLLLSILSIIFIFISLIKIPDIIQGSVTVSSDSPPINIVSNFNGRILNLKVKNNQHVTKGTPLITYETTSNYNSILTIDSILSNLTIADIINDGIAKKVQLLYRHSEFSGDLALPLIAFLRAYNDNQTYKKINLNSVNQQTVEDELSYNQIIFERHQTLEKFLNKEYELAHNDFDRYLKLYSNGVISTKEYDEKMSEFILAKRKLEDGNIFLINTKKSINNLKNNKNYYQLKGQIDRCDIEQTLIEKYIDIKAKVKMWKSTHIVIAPIDGHVSLNNFWAANQNVKSGDIVLSIIPSIKKQIIVKILVPLKKSGKISIGQVVNIKLNNYPWYEYGILKGSISQISLLPNEDVYVVDVYINEPTTTHGINIMLKENMTGSAEIIVESPSLLEKIINTVH